MEMYIHIGMQKTGTTYLQNEVFPKLKNVYYFSRPRDVFRADSEKEKKYLVSHEAFSGYPHHIDRIDYGVDDRYRIANRLNKVYPNAKIILGIREKDDWFKSLFRQYAKMKGGAELRDFEERFDEGFLDYEGYIAYLEDLFSDVYVYHFETLKEDHEEFVKGICDFMDVELPHVENVIYNKHIDPGKLEILHALKRIGS